MGHRGPGSILAYLKSKGLAHRIAASHRQFPTGKFSLVILTVQLTDHGERHVDSIIKSVFQYINMLRTELPSKPHYEVMPAQICHIS